MCGQEVASLYLKEWRKPEKAMAPHSSTLAWKVPWTEEPGRLQSMGSLGVRHNWATSLSLFLSRIGEGNGNPLQCSCLENPRDGGAWWAAVYGVAQSRTRLKRLSSSSSGGSTSWNQGCREEYRSPQICRWHHPYGRKWRGTKKPLDEGERGEWKNWLKIQHSENEDDGIWSHHFMGNRWGNSGNSVRLHFPQFIVIHTFKGFGIVNKAEIDVFPELSCFFDDPADVGNLISGSSAFSKTNLNIRKFTVHILLKPGLENFEHYFTSVWDECNCAVVWAFFGIAFLWDWNENWHFLVLWPLLSFLNSPNIQ